MWSTITVLIVRRFQQYFFLWKIRSFHYNFDLMVGSGEMHLPKLNTNYFFYWWALTEEKELKYSSCISVNLYFHLEFSLFFWFLSGALNSSVPSEWKGWQRMSPFPYSDRNIFVIGVIQKEAQLQAGNLLVYLLISIRQFTEKTQLLRLSDCESWIYIVFPLQHES